MRTRKWNCFLTAGVVLWGLFLGGLGGAAEKGTLPAEEAAFFKGKTIEFVVGTSAGGGYDTWARLMAPYLKKYTGAQSVVVVNMAGAASGKALDHVYRAKGTGGLMMLLSNGISQALTEALDFPETSLRWDSSKFNYIGRVTRDYNTLNVNPKDKTINDIRAKPEFLMATDSPLGSGSLHMTFFIEGLGLTNAKTVFGWAGGTEQRLALLQGTIHAETSSYDSSEQLYRAGELRPLCIMGKERLKRAPDVPIIWEFNPSPDASRWLNWVDSVDALGRLIVIPPDVPKNRVDFLREAMAKAMGDPDFLNATKKVGYTPSYLPASEIQKLALATSLSETDRKQLRYLMTEKWVKK